MMGGRNVNESSLSIQKADEFAWKTTGRGAKTTYARGSNL